MLTYQSQRVDGRVAVAGDQTELVAEREAVGGGCDGEAAVLVEVAVVGGGGLVADKRRTGIEGERLEAGVDDRTAPGPGGSSPSPRQRGSARRPW